VRAVSSASSAIAVDCDAQVVLSALKSIARGVTIGAGGGEESACGATSGDRRERWGAVGGSASVNGQVTIRRANVSARGGSIVNSGMLAVRDRGTSSDTGVVVSALSRIDSNVGRTSNGP